MKPTLAIILEPLERTNKNIDTLTKILAKFRDLGLEKPIPF